MAAELVQVLSTCPACKVEAALLGLVELEADHSRVVEGRCRLCARHERDGVLLDPGIRFRDARQVEAGLLRWAAEEGEVDLEAFVAAGFSGLETDRVVAALLAGQPVETSFDVIAWLFPGMAGGGAAPATIDAAELVRAVEHGSRGVLGARAPAVPPSVSPARPPPADPRRAAIRALAAVMLADGLIRPGERAFLDGFALRAGIAAIDEAELRPWRPADVGHPADPEPILLAMVELTFIDRQRDGSEWRVVREFARHWGYPLEHLERLGERKEQELAPAMVRLWRSLRRLVVTEG